MGQLKIYSEGSVELLSCLSYYFFGGGGGVECCDVYFFFGGGVKIYWESEFYVFAGGGGGNFFIGDLGVKAWDYYIYIFWRGMGQLKIYREA